MSYRQPILAEFLKFQILTQAATATPLHTPGTIAFFDTGHVAKYCQVAPSANLDGTQIDAGEVGLLCTSLSGHDHEENLFRVTNNAGQLGSVVTFSAGIAAVDVAADYYGWFILRGLVTDAITDATESGDRGGGLYVVDNAGSGTWLKDATNDVWLVAFLAETENAGATDVFACWPYWP